MKTLVKISAALGLLLGTQSAIASPFKADIISTEAAEATPNQMIDLFQDWGLKTVDCQEDVVKIKHDVTGDIGCAAPNEEIQAGNFIYNSAENTLSPMTAEQSNQLEAEATPPTPLIDNSVAAETENQENQDAKAQEFVFGFDNAYDYSACLDVILLAYEGRNRELESVAKNQCASNILSTFGTNLSKDVALQLVESADVHATEVLKNPLYPVLGIRRRVAINLGYVYDIDENNSDILELISSQSNQ